MRINRWTLLLIVFLFIMAVYIVKLFDYQLLHREEYLTSVENMIHRSTVLRGSRGRIIDRNGVPLAWDAPIYTITKNTTFLSDETRSLLGNSLDDSIDASSEIRKIEIFGSTRLNLPLNAVQELKKVSDITITEKWLRRSITDPSIAQILGSVRSDDKAMSGLELQYDDELRGISGEELIVVNSLAQTVRVDNVRPPINGRDIQITLDSSMSSFIYDELMELGNPAAAVVMKTDGEILAMVSSPSYDPNVFARGLTDREWNRLIYDPYNPLINRAMTPYSPGSLMKPFVALAGLIEDITPEATVNCTGSYQYKNSRGETIAIFRDWFLYGHQEVDLKKAIRVSCNVYFYQLGLELGIDTLNKYGAEWQLFEKTGIDLPEEKSGILPSPSWKEQTFDTPWYIGDTILSSIGQGYVAMTPLEIARFTGVIALRGKNVIPHLYGTRDATMLITEPTQENWDAIIEAMDEVTSVGGGARNEGTAYPEFKDAEYEVAAKTGTAEDQSYSDPHAWFTGFSPVENPEIIVTVFVENGGYGSHTAAPVARKIFDYYYGKADIE